MASVCGPRHTNSNMEQNTSFGPSRFQGLRPDHKDPEAEMSDLGVLDAMKDLDYEWNKPTTFFNVPSSGADHARLSAHHPTDHPTPISRWSAFNPTDDTAQPLQLNNFPSYIPSSSNFALDPTGTVPNMSPCTVAPSQMNINHQSYGDPYSSQSSGSGTGTEDSKLVSFIHSNTFSHGEDERPAKRRSVVSMQTESDSGDSTPAPTRGRRSSNVEPGTARAVYLEKNRYAARKCRTKQKKHQEVLVETARDMERKNKQLKAEVEFLKGDMRDLMGMVLQHSTCTDQRLTRYVQREADRLSGSGSSSPITKSEPLATPNMKFTSSSPEAV
ncbi:hypothetical protein B0J11DRAFT_263676 [Dendryphion nanum]|uniref:BZIP domain-containing protein n=1 Tax=Dendryphion nanum TaxID=256645 RepID=A0A9P9DZV8_9PLEO|nr:hypothetical protein B0J11DRAFT_263676 [Dendryphion nanum]